MNLQKENENLSHGSAMLKLKQNNYRNAKHSKGVPSKPRKMKQRILKQTFDYIKTRLDNLCTK